MEGSPETIVVGNPQTHRAGPDIDSHSYMHAPHGAEGEQRPLLPRMPSQTSQDLQVEEAALEVDRDLDRLVDIKHREELEEVYGMPVIVGFAPLLPSDRTHHLCSADSGIHLVSPTREYCHLIIRHHSPPLLCIHPFHLRNFYARFLAHQLLRPLYVVNISTDLDTPANKRSCFKIEHSSRDHLASYLRPPAFTWHTPYAPHPPSDRNSHSCVYRFAGIAGSFLCRAKRLGGTIMTLLLSMLLEFCINQVTSF